MACGGVLPRRGGADEENLLDWTWVDGRLLAFILSLVGLIGALLNSLVLVGVGGNARLGTTVNKLLIWICTIAILESTLGILMKALILGKKLSICITK
jgi:hypothetical protein